MAFAVRFFLFILVNLRSSFYLIYFQEKLAYFRIKELKDVLTKLGLSKQGKKQVRTFRPILYYNYGLKAVNYHLIEGDV